MPATDLLPDPPEIANSTRLTASGSIEYNPTIVYPSDLVHEGNRYGNQFMAIYINVDNNTSTDISNYKPKITTVDGIVVSRGTQSGGKGGVTTIGGVFVPPGNNITGSIIENFNSSQGGNFIDRDSTLDGGKSKTLKSIYLPIPLNISANAEAKYDGFDFGTEAAKIGFAALEGIADVGIKVLATRFGNIAGALGTQLKSIADKTATFALNATSAKSGTTLNPHKQLLFKGVELRNFTFQYKLVARNETETNTIDYIIRLLRYHMLPDLGDGIADLGGGLTLTYPSEFDMAFYMYDDKGNPKLNPYLPAISTCVLTKMDVTYGEKEIVSHADGSPVELTLSLSFQETQVMTKSVVKAFDSYIHGQGLAISPGVDGEPLKTGEVKVKVPFTESTTTMTYHNGFLVPAGK